jgi:hypothetical protein
LDPSSGEIHSESHLIKPPAHWDLNPVWDPDAEKLHGISVRQLTRDGWPPRQVADRMNQALNRRELFADSPVDDERWLKLLFDEAAVERQFELGHLKAGVLIEQLASAQGCDKCGYDEAREEASRLAPRRHRAEPDARYWAVLWGMISGDFGLARPHFGR